MYRLTLIGRQTIAVHRGALILALIPIIVAGILSMAPASAQDREDLARKQETQKSADKVKELQQQRLTTLKAMADLNTKLYQSGKASLEAALEARELVCEAELEAAETVSDRIAIFQHLVEVLKQHQEVAKEMKKSGRDTEAAVLAVKARLLDAEIHLETARTQTQAKNTPPEREKVVVTSAHAKDVVVTQQFVCQIHSRRHIDVRSLQSGYLEEIPVKEGQAVKQGEVLFKIAPLLYQAKLDAELAEIEPVALNLKNTITLSQKKLVSEDEVALLKAKLDSAKAKAKLAEAELNLTVVRAPFDGIIDRLQQHEGSLVTQRDILTTLSDNSVMWVYFNVPQTDYLEYMASAGKNQEEEIELVLAGGRTFPQPGKIAAIEAQFDSATGAIPFRADFPNPKGVLRHGMTGTVSIRQTLNNAIVIPQRATFEILGKRYVYVVDKEDVAHQREVIVQHELADDFVIKQGLNVNDRIVMEGRRRIHDGEKLEDEFQKP
jgi:membrane fusion protein (multidrug efflux system)